MWTLSVAWWELVVRSIIVYGVLIVLLRITGKRQVGQLAPFDLVLLLVLSNAVQNAMNGGDNSVTGGIISAVTLIGLDYTVGYLTFLSKPLHAAPPRPSGRMPVPVLTTEARSSRRATRSPVCLCVLSVFVVQ